MTGSAPAVTLTPAQVDNARPGDQITISVTISDADDTTEVLHTTDDLGRADTIQIVRDDPAGIVWSWEGGATVALDVASVTVAAPSTSGVLVAAITDGQGNEVVARCPVNVVLPMLVGVDVQGATTSAAEVGQVLAPGGLYGGYTGPTKLFWSAGKGLPTFTTGVTARVPASMIPHVCFVDFPTQQQWLGWLDSVPAAPWRDIYVTWLQEGDRHTTAADFVQRWQTLIGWAASHPIRRRIKLLPSLTWYWQRAHGDRYADWIPAGADGLSVDVYPGTKTNYTSPVQCLAAPVAAADAANLDLHIGECGVVVPANPTVAQRQAQADWYAGLISAARTAGVRALAIWCTTGDQGDFRVYPGDPAYAVLRAEVA